MTDNEICTFELDFSQTKLGLAPRYLGETHQLLKNPNFSELNKMISCYPPSPPAETETRPVSRRMVRGSSSARVFERSPYTEEDHYKECTFKPKINTATGKENLKSRKIPLAQKLANLSRSKREIIENREKAKRNEEIQQAIEFSYTPAITYHQSKPTIPIESRFKYERSRIEEREKMRRMQEVDEEAQCTFKPAISKRNLNNPVPLFKRVDEVQIEKLRNFTQLKQKYEIDLSFKPKINEKSRNLSNQRKINNDSKTSTKCLSRTASCKQISFTSQDLSPYQLPKREQCQTNEFINRQNQFREKAQENLRKQIESKEKEFNFTPVINKTSSILVETSNSPKTLMQKVRKLSDGNLDKVRKIETIRENFYSQFSHSPEINEKSQKIGRTSSIERLTQTNKDKLNAKRIEEVQMQDLNNCTFYPNVQVAKQFRYVKSCYRQDSDISANIERNLIEKGSHTRDLKNKRDYEELKNCSFRPEVNTQISKSGNISTVKGLDRYLELKEIAKRMTREKYEREMKVFCKRPPSNYTSRS